MAFEILAHGIIVAHEDETPKRFNQGYCSRRLPSFTCDTASSSCCCSSLLFRIQLNVVATTALRGYHVFLHNPPSFLPFVLPFFLPYFFPAYRLSDATKPPPLGPPALPQSLPAPASANPFLFPSSSSSSSFKP